MIGTRNLSCRLAIARAIFSIAFDSCLSSCLASGIGEGVAEFVSDVAVQRADLLPVQVGKSQSNGRHAGRKHQERSLSVATNRLLQIAVEQHLDRRIAFSTDVEQLHALSPAFEAGDQVKRARRREFGT